MAAFTDSAAAALQLIASNDPALWAIVGRSLAVSGSACLLGAGFGIALGAALAAYRFAGQRALVLLLNTLLALPAVREKLAEWGYETVGSTPEEFTAFARGEMAKWNEVINDANIKLD